MGRTAVVALTSGFLSLLPISAESAPGDTDLVTGEPTKGGVRLAETGPTDAVSAGGRYVAFAAGDVNSDPVRTTIYLRDRQDRSTVVVSRDASGAARVGLAPSISASGRYVVFASGDALIPSDSNDTVDVYVFDVQTQRNERVSVTSGEAQANCPNPYSTGYADISADGRYVTFTSCANLTARAEDNDGLDHVYLRDRKNGTTELVFPVAVGDGHLQWGQRTSVSDDGRFVFWSHLLRDRLLNTWTTVPLYSDQASGPSYVQDSSMSGNGRYIVYTGYGDVEPGDTNGASDIWLRDLRTGAVERMSLDSEGRPYASWSYYPHISADGRFVAFYASQREVAGKGWQGLTPGGWEGIYVRDRQSGTLEYTSVDSFGGPSYSVRHPSLSADGMFVAFETEAPLNEAEFSQSNDVYVHERGLIRTPVYDIGVFPAVLDFGDRALGTKPGLRTYIKNRGPSILIIRKVSIVGADRQSFAHNFGSFYGYVFPGDTSPVRVTSKATTLGPKSAELQIRMGTDTVRRVALSSKIVPP